MKTTRSVTTRRARPVFEEPWYVAPRYHSKIWGRLIFALLILALFGGFGVFGGVYWSLHRAQSSSAAAVPVHVGAGDTVTSIANRLQSRGIISNALLFRLDARLQKLGSKLEAGDYVLRRNMSIDQMVTALGIYTSRTIRFTIPEGRRLEQVAAIVGRAGINQQQFLREALHPDIPLPILASKPRWASLEGYLFPNTYRVPPHYNARLLVKYMLQTLSQQFTPRMRADAAKRGLSVYQVLTLASIVEREAKAPDERPLIASVYENRLRTHQGLFADPTVQYAVGRPGNWWPVLTAPAGQIDPGSPYNTYTHRDGLPPGPIANPGLASIVATIYPKPTNFFYFVYKGHGRHVFEQTLAEHNADVSKYQP